MPLFHFHCPKCDTHSRRICTLDVAKLAVCADCGEALVRSPRPPSTRVVETLDNGIMAKRVERPADAERLFAERARMPPEKEK